MDPVTFDSMVCIAGVVIVFLTHAWVSNLEDMMNDKLAERDLRINLLMRYEDFLFRLTLEQKDAPDFTWNVWLNEAQTIDQQLSVAQLSPPMSLEQVVLTVRDKHLAAPTKGGAS